MKDRKDTLVKGREDTRDARKSDDVDDEYPKSTDESQQAAELQVGEEGERENPSRFEPDPKAEPERRGNRAGS